MSDIIVLLIVLTVSLFLIIRSFEPHIDIIQIGPRHYKVLLWYNSIKEAEIKRKWIKLFEYKQRSS